MLFELSNVNSNLALTLGYLNPALNNSALNGKANPGLHFCLINTGLSLSDEASKMKFLNIERE